MLNSCRIGHLRLHALLSAANLPKVLLFKHQRRCENCEQAAELFFDTNSILFPLLIADRALAESAVQCIREDDLVRVGYAFRIFQKAFEVLWDQTIGFFAGPTAGLSDLARFAHACAASDLLEMLLLAVALHPVLPRRPSVPESFGPFRKGRLLRELAGFKPTPPAMCAPADRPIGDSRRRSPLG
jgi:hypothetical protein